MVNAVGKPDAFRIFEELLEIITVAIAAVRGDDRRKQLPNTQIANPIDTRI